MTTDGGWQLPGAGWGPTVHHPARPGVIPLRPLGVADLLGAVFDTVRRCTKAVYLPVLAAAGVAIGLLGVAVGAVAFSLEDTFGDLDDEPLSRLADGRPADLTTTVVIAALVVLCCLAGLYAVGYTTATTVVRHAVVGRQVTAGQIWREAKPFVGRVLAAQLLAGLGSLAVVAASAVPGGLLGLTGRGWSGAGFALVLPGFALALYAQVRLVLLVPVLVLENVSPAVAIRRAWGLNKGAWWRSLGIPYVVAVVGSTAAQLLLLPCLVLGLALLAASSAAAGQISLLGAVLFAAATGLGLVLGLAVTLPLAPVAHSLLYVDRRIRREDFGTLLNAEAGVPRWGRPAPALR
ncbi:hypothetical protein ABT095_34780 [Kitasatospora sp. NPDC002227]|uniref:hypothetical protein n=1 Tax=Kitasatospora sp. NPDC002227 TaxID=3154773 RepID=UPI00331A14D2